MLHANAGRAGKYQLPSRLPFSSESLISRVLRQHATEIGLRAEIPGRSEAVQSEEVSLCALQRIVPLIPDVCESRPSDSGRRGIKRDQILVLTKRGCKVAGLHPPKIKAVGDGARSGARAWLSTSASYLLPQINLSLQTPGGESGDVKTVVVEDGVSQPEPIAVEKLRDGIAD